MSEPITMVEIQRVRDIAAEIRDGTITLSALIDSERLIVAHGLERLADDLTEAALPDKYRRKQKGRDA